MSLTLQLPSCLSQSTLGDVLGVLHRQGLSGVLQLLAAGTTNEIELRDGLVARVTLGHDHLRLGDELRRRVLDTRHFERMLHVALSRSTDERPLGERLVATGGAPLVVVSAAVQELHQTRLERLFCTAQGKLRFRVLHRPTFSGLVLGPAAFLHHRRRHRERAPAAFRHSPELQRAYRVLGLTPGASVASIKAAFKRCAASRHPDRFAHLGQDANEAATRHFRESAESYRILMDNLSQG